MTRTLRSGFVLVFSLTMSVAAPGLVVAQNVSVSGTITRQDDTPISGALVRIRDVASTTTDSGGRFRFPPVSPGRYELIAQAIGYRVTNSVITLGKDTVVKLILERVPTALDTVVVRSGEATIRGRVRDSITKRRLLDAQATLHPSARTVGALSGDFTIRNVPLGEITIVVEAFEHLPKQITFTPHGDTTLTIDLAVDSVALRMIVEQGARLEKRANALPYSLQSFNRGDIELSGVFNIADLVKRRVRGRPDSTCVFLDDRQVGLSVLRGLPLELVERVEVFEATGGMTRVYSKRYIASLMGEKLLPRIVYMKNGLAKACN